MPPRIQVSTHFVRPLARALAAGGVEPNAFLAACGLGGEHPTRVPIETAIAAWDAAVKATGDPALGVRAAQALVPGDYGVLEYAARSSATLRDAYERVGRYQSLLNDRAVVQFDDVGERTHMRYLHTNVPPAYVEFVMGSWVVSGRSLPEGPLPIVAVYLPHPQSAESDPQHELFGPALLFESGRSELVLDRAAFLRPLRGDPALVGVLDRHAEQMMDALSRSQAWTGRATAWIEAHLAEGTPRLSTSARALNVPPRTLRRRLEDEGETFSGLVDSTRKRVALELVEDPALSLGEIAFLLGFSEPSAFHRAFRRWTGRTPRAR